MKAQSNVDLNQPDQWTDWRWHLRHSLRSMDDLKRHFKLVDSENLPDDQQHFAIGITPYYAQLIDADDPDCPIRKTMLPNVQELNAGEGEQADPLGEDPFRPVDGIVHRYRNRCLFLTTGRCATYCRYCTRSRLVGDPRNYETKQRHWQEAIDYIAAHPEVNDVILSGGDPLTLPDDDLKFILQGIRPHVDIIRLGTKLPVVLPYRITPALISMLKEFQPIYWSIHVTHPKELTPDVSRAITMIADAGMPMGSQTVLLKGINDDKHVLHTLMRRLLKLRVKPYYLFQPEPIAGSAHLRPDIVKGREIWNYLRENLGGYGVPRYVIDLPGKAAKYDLSESAQATKVDKGWQFEIATGEQFFYPD